METVESWVNVLDEERERERAEETKSGGAKVRRDLGRFAKTKL